MSGFPTVTAFEAALRSLPGPDLEAAEHARTRQAQLTKPPGSLGRLEEIVIFLAGWQRREMPRIDRGRVLVFAGNHGITARGVSAYPAEVTAQMVANFRAGGAAINALSRAAGLELDVIPIDLDRPTANFTAAPAMTEAECLNALSVGASAVTPDLDILVLGEMGIGNTTPAAALCAHSFGGAARDWAGPGTGLTREGVTRKAALIDEALAFHRQAALTPFEVLRRLGGREIAAIAGAVLAARLHRVPVVLDGFICCAAVAPLAVAVPHILDHCLAGHCSAETGHVHLLDKLGLAPILRLDMRLGEGSGAAVAVSVIRSALATHAEMATFAQAGVSGSEIE